MDLTPLFPENVVTILTEEIEKIDPNSITVLKRPLRPTDPNLTIGVFSVDWNPEEHEIGGTPDPSLARYMLGIQSLVKAASEEEGIALHTNLAHRLRTMLYRSATLRVRLGSESIVSDLGITESVQRWGVRTQRYMSNEIQGEFVYLSVTEFWIDTQTV